MLENFTKDLEKGFKELSKASADLLERQRVQNDLRTLRRKKEKTFLELGKRAFTISEEKDEIKREDLLDLISQIKNIDELIKNVKFTEEKRQEAKANEGVDNNLGGATMVDDEVELESLIEEN